MGKNLSCGLLALALFAYLPVASAQGNVPSLTGSFVKFDRNLTTVQMWERELSLEAALGHKILVIPGDGSLMASSADSTGFTVNPRTLIYPSERFPAPTPQQDNLGMVLTAADEFGMQVYVGSLQTYGDWTDGSEFAALHKFDSLIAREILARYGQHRSLNSGSGNWYFSHELWLNWVKVYGAGYYGISELGTYVAEMKAISPRSRVIEAPVFKETEFATILATMPGLTPQEAGTYVSMLAAGSQVDVIAPQDGAGAQDGAPAVSELGNYYCAMLAALQNQIAAGTVELWSTTETFQASDADAETANGWQPAPVSRIQQQIAGEASYVSQMIEFMYGWDMSPEATYTPVEADTLLAQFTGDASGTRAFTGGTVSYTVAPSGSYMDAVPSKLTNGTGGGFGESLANDWVGFEANTSGTVTITVDLGGPQTVSGIRTLFAGSTISSICFPDNVVMEYSDNGGVSWIPLGNPDGNTVGRDTPPLYSVGWVNATNGTPVIASQVRVTVNFHQWLFIGEIKVVQP